MGLEVGDKVAFSPSARMTGEIWYQDYKDSTGIVLSLLGSTITVGWLSGCDIHQNHIYHYQFYELKKIGDFGNQNTPYTSYCQRSLTPT